MTDRNDSNVYTYHLVNDARDHPDLVWSANIHTHPGSELTPQWQYPSTADAAVGNYYGITMYVASPPNYLYVHYPAPGDYSSQPVPVP
jgi:hypothetical protein